MNFQELLLNRRSIRNFQQRDVPEEALQTVIRDSCLAPSASNGQPCHFLVITNRETMKKISTECKKNILADFANNSSPLDRRYEAVVQNGEFNIFYNAPALIYIAGSPDIRSLDVDCAMAASYLMFSAAQNGLGTCWIGFGTHVRNPAIKKEIGLLENLRIVAPLIIGYPQEIPVAPARNAPRILKIVG